MTDSQRKLFAASTELISRRSASAEASLPDDQHEVKPGPGDAATQELRRTLHARVDEGTVRRFVDVACVRVIHDLFVTSDGGLHDSRMLIVDGDTGEESGEANNEYFVGYLLITKEGASVPVAIWTVAVELLREPGSRSAPVGEPASRRSGAANQRGHAPCLTVPRPFGTDLSRFGHH